MPPINQGEAFMLRTLMIVALCSACSIHSWAQEESVPVAPAAESVTAAEPAPAAVPAPTARVAVILPEQVDGDWYWYDAGAGQQHLAQTAFEKAFVQAGFEILDVANIGGRISFEELINPKTATAKGRELGADYVVAGKATASKASEGSAYGVNVIRARAEITARLVRVSDGKVLAVEDGFAESGGQAVKTAGQEALKKASPPVARKLAAALRKTVPAPEAAPAP
jgi:curli biogenesis system outer membrane secretion channel CsgG